MGNLSKQLKEDGVNFGRHFMTYLKWLALSLLIGVIMGGIGAAFFYSLKFANEFRGTHGWLIWLLPLAGLVIVFLYRKFDKAPTEDEENRGTNMVLAAVNSKEAIPKRMTAMIFISSVVSHFFGASVGREGAALQMGAGIGSSFAQLFRLNENDTRILLMTGMAAGFSAIFGAPLAAAVFAMEVISVGVMYYAALVPCVFSALTARYTAALLGVKYTSYVIPVIPKFTPFTAGMSMVMGIAFAIISIIICLVLILSEKFFKTIFENNYVRIFVAGTMVALMTLLVGNQAYNGLSENILSMAVAGQAVWYAFLIKLVFTAVSLAGGYRGGEIVPSLIIGATFGCFLAPLLGMPAELGAALGMISVFCGVTNSPIASFVMGLELFGGKGIWFFGIVVAVSYMLSGYYGLYKSQLIIYSKYRSVYVRRKAHR